MLGKILGTRAAQARLAGHTAQKGPLKFLFPEIWLQLARREACL